MSKKLFISPGNPGMYRNPIWLRKRYKIEKKTEQEMADEAGCSQATIHRMLKTFDLI